MKDFFKQPLAVGDVVAFIPNGYRDLVRGRITAFTPKQVRIVFTNTWNFSAPGIEDWTLRYPNVIIKDPLGNTESS